MNGHGRSPGPGHALVVQSVGYSVPDDLRSPPEAGLALSGEGALACAWLALNPTRAKVLTLDLVGLYVPLPMDDEFGLAILKAFGSSRRWRGRPGRGQT